MPKLRFPEFRDTPGWSKRPLGEILTPIVREREKPAVPYTGLGIRSHGRGTFRKELEPPEKTSMDRLYEVDCDDLIVNITFAWEGAIAIVRSEDAGALVSHRFPTYQFGQNAVLTDFFRYPILDKQFIYNLGVISPGGAGRNRVLNKTGFLKIELALPEVAEQQKIADCLGSLDDLIAAEGRKLEALRQHKQGLMQQLFPQPGETVPRLRFPEFQDAPDWKTGRCRDIAKVLPGYGFPDKFQGNKKGHYPFYKVSDISNTIEKGQKYISEANNYIDSDVLDNIRGKSVPAGTIIFAKIGEAIRSNRRVITTMPAVIDNNTAGLKAMKAKSSDEFLFYLWSNVSLIDHAGGVVPAVNKSALENVPLCYPSDPAEQQRIADCLSALSTRIGAQMSKLDTLRTHKQGFMQQLFPSLEGH